MSDNVRPITKNSCERIPLKIMTAIFSLLFLRLPIR